MGKFFKNHWARLIMLVAAVYQLLAAVSGIFWPKIVFDVVTPKLNVLVKPHPFLQLVNIFFSILIIMWELPLKPIAGTAMHRSIVARLVVFTLSAFVCGLLYQGTNACVYTLIGMVFYSCALLEHEVVHPVPWTFSNFERV